MFAAALTVAPAIAYMVPRNTPTDQLRELSKEACEVEDNWFQPLNGSPRLKMRTSYYGNLAFQHNPSISAHVPHLQRYVRRLRCRDAGEVPTPGKDACPQDLP